MRLRTLIQASLGLGAWLLACPSLSAQLAPRLSVASAFPTTGGELVIQLEAPPGVRWQAFAALELEPQAFGASGTLYLGARTLTPLSDRIVPAQGSDSLRLAIPADPFLEGAWLHVQAAASSGAEISLTRVQSIRILGQPANGARFPQSVAIASRAGKAFVVHRDDATVSVIDLQQERLLAELPLDRHPLRRAPQATQVVVDPAERFAFVLREAARSIAVIDVTAHALTYLAPIDAGVRNLAIDPRSGLLYASDGARSRILVFEATIDGRLLARGNLALQGRGPDALLVLDDGSLVVAQRETHELEHIDGWNGTGGTRRRLALRRVPHDLARSGTKLLVPTFTPLAGTPGGGANHLLEIDATTLTVSTERLRDRGTDYLSAAAAGLRSDNYTSPSTTTTPRHR